MTPLSNPPFPSPRFAAGPLAVLLAAASGFGWTASGTVRSTTGTALSQVAVTVADSAGYNATTSATGAFTIGSPTGVHLGARDASAWQVRASGRTLEIRSPEEGTLELSLVDNQGRTLWTTSTTANGGLAWASLPQGMRSGAAILRIRGTRETYDAAVVVGPDGARIASHLVAPRSLAAFPVLKFRKSGYRDTTYAMNSETAANLAIAMRDTTSVAVTCPATKLATGDQTRTLSIGGVSRTYILHVPSSYAGTSAVPLVVDFHPIGGSASGELGSSPYKGKTDPEGVLSAYPNGLASPNLGQAWNVQGCCTTANDTAFARAIVADVKNVGCVDPKRVYAVGFSMGGGMTHFSACHLSDIFAAGAPAAFDLTEQNVPACKPKRPLTMVIFRGTADNVVPYAGGHSALVTGMAIDFLGAKATFQKWASLNQCTGSPSAEDANGCSTYSTCAAGVQVTLCTKQGGGHEYGNATVGWPILKKYTLP